VDGYFFPKTVPEIFNAREQAQVPLLLGWNSAEIPGMAFMQGLPYTEENYVKKIKDAYPTDFDQVLILYPMALKKKLSCPPPHWLQTGLSLTAPGSGLTSTAKTARIRFTAICTAS